MYSLHVSFAQSNVGDEYYEKAYTEIANMLDGNLDYEKDICEPIQKDVAYMKRWMVANNLSQYKTAKQITLCNFFFYPGRATGIIHSGTTSTKRKAGIINWFQES